MKCNNADDSIKLYSAEPDSVGAETLEDLRFTLRAMLKALDRPVIDIKDLPKAVPVDGSS